MCAQAQAVPAALSGRDIIGMCTDILPYFHTCILPNFHTFILAYFHPSVLPYLHTCILPFFITCTSILSCTHTPSGIAQTGSGKTLCYLWPLLYHVLDQPQSGGKGDGGPVALILAPTRELAMQIHTETRALTHHHGLRTAVIFGGASKSVFIGQTLSLPRLMCRF